MLNGLGTLELDAANSFTGGIAIDAGTLFLKDGLAAVKASLTAINSQLPKSQLSARDKAQVQVMVLQAQDIVDAVEKDRSWGVHAPTYTLRKVNEARLLTDGAKAALAGKPKAVAMIR